MPRCPTCAYPVPTPGRCSVCVSGVPVHRVTVAEMQAAYAALVEGPAQVQRRRALQGQAPRPPRPPWEPEPRQAYACEMPGCRGEAQLQPIGYRRMQGRGQVVRCAPCQAVHRRDVEARANAKYRARQRQREGG